MCGCVSGQQVDALCLGESALFPLRTWLSLTVSTLRGRPRRGSGTGGFPASRLVPLSATWAAWAWPKGTPPLSPGCWGPRLWPSSCRRPDRWPACLERLSRQCFLCLQACHTLNRRRFRCACHSGPCRGSPRGCTGGSGRSWREPVPRAPGSPARFSPATARLGGFGAGFGAGAGAPFRIGERRGWGGA